MSSPTRTQTEKLLNRHAPNLSLEKTSRLANLWCTFFADQRISFERLLNTIAEKISRSLTANEQVQSRKQKLALSTPAGEDEVFEGAPPLQAEFSRITPAPQFQASRALLQQEVEKSLQDKLKANPALAKQISPNKIRNFLQMTVNASMAAATATNRRELQLIDDFSNSEIGAWDTFRYYLYADASMVQNNGQLAYIAMNEVDVRFAATVFKTGLEKVCHEKFALEEIIRLYLGVCRHCEAHEAALKNANIEQYAEQQQHIPAP